MKKHKRNNHKKSVKKKHHLEYIPPLDLIKKNRTSLTQYQKYTWDVYYELEYKRQKVRPKIREVLLNRSMINYKLDGWQRVVKAKYMLEPLSYVGSIRSIGGRFNIFIQNIWRN